MTQRILTGQTSADIYAKLFRASFDEHLSCVELLLSGLHNYISEALTEDALTTEAYEFLKHYQKELKENGSYHTLLQRKQKNMIENKAGTHHPGTEKFPVKNYWNYFPHGPRTPPSHQRSLPLRQNWFR